MPLFRKKPIAVEAHQWFKNGDHPMDFSDRDNADRRPQLEGLVVRYFRHPDVPGNDVCPSCGRAMYQHGWIDSVNTLNPSGCTVCPGDWILPELSDPTKFYPCKPGIFSATYEPVEL